MEQLSTKIESDTTKHSPDNFINDFYSRYRNLDLHEKKILLLNLNAQLRHRGINRVRSGLAGSLTNREREVLVLPIQHLDTSQISIQNWTLIRWQKQHVWLLRIV